MFALLAALLATAAPAPTPAETAMRQRPAADEIIYFALPDRFENGDPGNDRGGLVGDRLVTGFDPTSKAFYNGGDLKGLTQRLDYIAGLGATTIWLGPIFKNKPVQGGPGRESAGFHGYWITDFTRVDPHFGSNDDLKALIAAAHARGIKVYLDIVTNHTADVIQYRECVDKPCPYRTRGDYPYSRRGGLAGAAINDGFTGDHVASAANWAKLTRPDFAYTPFVPKGEEHAKTPDWLNDPIYYHNRGESTFRNESSQFGDFVSLDDIATEHPRVVAGLIDIYGWWIDEFGIDGYRIDTAQHVNPEFWQLFVPAMQARARARGIPNFHIFGEVSIDEVDVGRLARHTRVDRLPNVLDFATWAAAIDVIAGARPTSALARLYADDPLYEGGTATARSNPTFISNHDKGRFAYHVARANRRAGADELAARVLLGHALMLLGRGVPTLYAGDEQGFVGDGNDNDAREPLFASKVASYNDNRLLGSRASTATANFNADHPFYRALAEMAAVRKADARLRQGETLVREAGDTPGIFAMSRVIPGQAGETLVAINTTTRALTANVRVDPASLAWTRSAGACPATAAAPGTLTISLPPLGWAVCRSEGEAK
ncbi:MAG: alpha-amylase [Alphaproteobacteria bacterium PA4]|nr:MAG: alpha-amylase [Alphaproteobacteria bacterium PA4]